MLLSWKNGWAVFEELVPQEDVRAVALDGSTPPLEVVGNPKMRCWCAGGT